MPRDGTLTRPSYDLENNKADRLRFLADVVLSKSDDEFNMDMYSNHCGTVRCALGWAWTVDVFLSLGLVAPINPPHFEDGTNAWDGKTENWQISDDAVEQAVFFGLSNNQFERCFFPKWYDSRLPTRQEVATRIREVAAEVEAKEMVV